MTWSRADTCEASPGKVWSVRVCVRCLPCHGVCNTHPHVGHLVIVKVGGGCECFPTQFTLVWLLSCVDPPVCVETGAGGETFITEVTNVGSLSSVGSDVSLQQAGSVELLATGITGK